MHFSYIKSLCVGLLLFPIINSFAQSDELNAVFADLIYDVNESYTSGSAVVVSLEDGEIYTASQDVPAAADGSNNPKTGANKDTYWGDSASTTQQFEDKNPTFLNDLPSDIDTETLSTQVAALSDPASNTTADILPEVGDILIENTNTGERGVWKIYGAKWQFQTEEVLLSGGAIIDTYSSTTEAFGAGDFDNDGNVDLAIFDGTTGAIKLEFMSGNEKSTQITVGTLSTTETPVAVADFNSDGLIDFVTENHSSGMKKIHFLSGSERNLSIGSNSLVVTNSGFKVVGAGDFNKDGNPDLLAEQIAGDSNALTKVDRVIWLMNDSSITSTTNVFLNFAQEWRMKGTGDFDNDGNLDIMVEQDETGRKGIWYMNQTQLRDGFTYLTLLPDWVSGCSGDFNKDGSNDPVFFNKSSGKVIVLNLSNQSSSDNQFGNQYAFLNISRNFVSAGDANAGTDWKMRGFIDFNGDNTVDLIADNTSTGEKATWQISSSNSISSIVFATKLNWRMCGTGQFGGDSTEDIVAENISTGEKEVWIMSFSGNNFSISDSINFATDSSVRIVGVGDFNGDSKPDLVVEGLTTNSDPLAKVTRQIWYMNGTSKSSVYTFLDFNQEWRMRGVIDYDKNGYPDILVQQDQMGRKGIWAMKDSNIEYGFTFTTVSPFWSFPLQ